MAARQALRASGHFISELSATWRPPALNLQMLVSKKKSLQKVHTLASACAKRYTYRHVAKCFAQAVLPAHTQANTKWSQAWERSRVWFSRGRPARTASCWLY